MRTHKEDCSSLPSIHSERNNRGYFWGSYDRLSSWKQHWLCNLFQPSKHWILKNSFLSVIISRALKWARYCWFIKPLYIFFTKFYTLSLIGGVTGTVCFPLTMHMVLWKDNGNTIPILCSITVSIPWMHMSATNQQCGARIPPVARSSLFVSVSIFFFNKKMPTYHRTNHGAHK